MNVVGYGGGTNSTAMLIGMYHRNIPVDLILFSDTGCEQRHTYAYLPVMEQWLLAHVLDVS
jgi:3'-phosphoadenosine 5'-phosphosulfate sulfotransferase (PAPS reductase)/FAD synthetase